MTMNRYFSSRQESIQHTLTAISRRCTQIKILTKTRIGGSLL